MKRRERQSRATGIPKRSIRSVYSTTLYRKCCRWDVLFVELMRAYDKALRAVQSSIKSPELKYSLAVVQATSWLFARGADLAITRYCANRLAAGESYNLAELCDEVLENLLNELATEWRGLLLNLVELTRTDFPGRDSEELARMIEKLKYATRTTLSERCAEGGDLRTCLTDPLSSHDGYFSVENHGPLPATRSSNLNQVVYDLSLRIESNDTHAQIKPKLVFLIKNDPWFVDELNSVTTEAEKDAFEQLDEDTRVRNIDAQIDGAVIIAMDKYAFSSRRWDGRSPLEVWLERQPLLDEHIKRVTLRWADDRFFSIFWVRRAFGSNVDVVDVRDERVYTIAATSDKAAGTFERDMVVTGTIQPWDDEWFWSGAQTMQGYADEQKFAKIVIEARSMPRSVRRDRPSEDLDLLLEECARQYDAWMSLHGSEEKTFETGKHFEEAFVRFLEHLTENVPTVLTGKTPAQILREQGKAVPPAPGLQLTPTMLQAKDVSIIWHRSYGWNICEGYPLLKSAFATEHAPTVPEIEIVRDSLMNYGIDPWLFQRLGEKFPLQTERLFQFVLRDKGFTFDRFGDVIRKFKGQMIRDHSVGSIKLVRGSPEDKPRAG